MLQTYYPKPSRKLFLPFTYPIVLDGFVRVDMCNNLLDCYKIQNYNLFYKNKILLQNKSLCDMMVILHFSQYSITKTYESYKT